MFELPVDSRVNWTLPIRVLVSAVDAKRYLIPSGIPLDESDPEGHLAAANAQLDRIRKSRESKLLEWTVNDYKVALNGKQWSCTCKGFQFRKQCKHIKQIQECVTQ